MRRFLPTLVLIGTLATTAKATHISGGEIYWECLGNNQYEITLIIYRDCFGVQLNNSFDVNFDSPCGNFTRTVNTPNGTELSQLCDLELPNSTCNGGTLPGIEQYSYTTTVTLPPCNAWTISWSLANRNAAIANLVSPNNEQMYVQAVLDNSAGQCEDSPHFTSIASPYVCLNYPVTYSLGAYDPESDSLTYTLIQAMGQGAAPINYVAPYSPNQPITGLTLDPQTGLISFTPTLQGNWVVVVEVNSYDSLGNWMGSVMRDMQFVVYPCTNVPPDASTGVIGTVSGAAIQTGPNAIQVCESGNICFDFIIADANANNVLDAVTNVQQTLPGATFSFTGTNPITCTVCWTGSQGTAGFYPFIVTVDDGACPIPAFQIYVYEVTVIDGIFIDAASTNESCAGMNDGSVSVDVTEGTAPYQYNWGILPQNSDSINVGAGTYSVVVSDANGCVSAPATVTVGTTTPPSANGGNNLTVCLGGTTALSGTAQNSTSTDWSGGSGAFSGNGNNQQYFPTQGEIANGGVDLYFSANGNSGCPPDIDTVHVTYSNAFLGAGVSAVNATCNGGGNGSASFTPNNAALTYQWNTNPVQNTATATNLGAGNYSVTVTDPIGCDTTMTVAVGAPQAITISNVQVVNETCAGQGNGSVSITVTGGTSPYQYLWSNGATTSSITVGAGNYTVQVTDANGCAPAMATANVLAAAQPNAAQAGPDAVVCDGTIAQQLNGSVVNATGGIWSGGSGSFSGGGLNPQYTPSAGEITVGGVDLYLTTTGNAGCPPDTDTIHISYSNAFLTASVSAVDATCNGNNNGSASFTPNNGALSYLWNTVPVQNTATATGLGAGNYTVTATDALGCDVTMTVTVGAPQAIAVSNVQVVDETCAGQGNGSVTITVTGGTAPYQYLWSNGANTPSITVGAGVYTVQVTDANGCEPGMATATVLSAAQPNQALAGSDQVVCNDDFPFQLNGNVINATSGFWSGSGSFSGGGLTPQYTPSAGEIAAGYAQLLLTTLGNTGCPQDVDTLLVTLPNSFQGATIITSPSCSNSNNGSASYSPALPGLTYLWNPGGATTSAISGQPAGNYTLLITDAYGCDTTMTAVITAPPALVIPSVIATDPTCSYTTDGTIAVSASGGTPGYTYQWSANANSQTSAMAIGLGTGTYVVVVTDAAGCTAQTSVALTAPAPVTLVAQVPDTVCVNAPVVLTAQATGGDGNYTITWSGIGLGSPITYSFPFSQTVMVTATDGNGCNSPMSSEPVTVLNLSLANLDVYGDTIACSGEMASVSATVNNYPGNYTITWPQLGVTGNGPISVPMSGNQVIVANVLDQCGATLTGSVQLILDVPPTITLPPVLGVGCAPLTVQMPDSLTTQNVSYLWEFGDGDSSTDEAPAHTYNAGVYNVSLTVTTAYGCTSTAVNTGLVTAYGAPTAAFSASTSLTDFANQPISFTDQSPGDPVGFDWDFGDGNSSTAQDVQHTYNDVGVYTVTITVTDSNGCTGSASQNVEITPIYDIDIPTGFTPNPGGGNGGGYDPNDLSNDVFYPFVRFVKEFNMRVYNRWGELVFESNDVRIGWDGYYKGQMSQQDVYAYTLRVRFIDGREVEKMGDITLFR